MKKPATPPTSTSLSTAQISAPWTQREQKPLPSQTSLRSLVFLIALFTVGILGAGFYVELGNSKFVPGEVIPSMGVREVKTPAAGALFELPKDSGDRVSEGDVIAVLYFDERTSREVQQLLTELKGFLNAYGVEAPLPVFPHRELPNTSLKELESKYKDLQNKYQKCAISYEKKRTRTANEVAPLQAQENNFVARIEKLKSAKPTPAIKKQIEDGRLERESLKTRIAILKNQIESEYFDLSQALVADAKEYTEYLETILHTREVKSPMNGRLGPFKAAKGTLLSANQILTTILPENSEPLFQGIITPNEAKLLKVGQSINIRIHNQETAQGTIVSLEKAKGSSNNIQMKATIQFLKGRTPAQESSLEGLKAEASIHINSRSMISVLFNRFYDWPL